MGNRGESKIKSWGGPDVTGGTGVVQVKDGNNNWILTLR